MARAQQGKVLQLQANALAVTGAVVLLGELAKMAKSSDQQTDRPVY